MYIAFFTIIIVIEEGDIMDYAKVGRKIREERRKLGWTQEKLAESVGISVNFLSLIENGRNMSLETMINFSKAFGVSVDYLLSDVLEIKTDNITDQINSNLSELTFEERLFFLNMIKQYRAIEDREKK